MKIFGFLIAFFILSCPAPALLANEEIDNIFLEEVYFSDQFQWNDANSWKEIYDKTSKIDPNYYRVGYAKLQYLYYIYEDSNGLLDVINSARNVIREYKVDNKVNNILMEYIKSSSILKSWENWKQEPQTPYFFMQDEIRISYIFLIDSYIGIDDFEEAEKYIQEFENALSPDLKFYAYEKKQWMAYKKVHLPYVEKLIEENDKFINQLKWDIENDSLITDSFYQRNKISSYFELKNIDAGLELYLFRTINVINSYNNIIQEMEKIQNEKPWLNLSGEHYRYNLSLVYLLNNDFKEVESIYNENMYSSSIWNFLKKYLTVLSSYNRIGNSLQLINNVEINPISGFTHGTKKTYLGMFEYYNGNFINAIKKLEAASKYKETVMYSGSTITQYLSNVYTMLANCYNDYLNYLSFRNKKLNFVEQTINQIIMFYYKFLAIMYIKQLDYMVYFADLTDIDTLPILIKDLGKDAIISKLTELYTKYDKRPHARKYYDLLIAYRYIYSGEEKKAKEYLNLSNPETKEKGIEIKYKNEKIFLAMYYNALCMLHKQGTDEYNKSVTKMFQYYPQFVVLKGQKPILKIPEIKGEDTEEIREIILDSIKEWNIEWTEKKNLPQISIQLDKEEENKYSLNVIVTDADTEARRRKFSLSEKDIQDEKYIDDIFDAIFNFNQPSY